LRLSRAAVDDPITTNLNALLAPAEEGFDPASASVRLPYNPSKHNVNPGACRSFQNDVLFPSWQTRTDILHYCAAVATSPDSPDPDLKSTADSERIIDERFDPYSARFFPRETRTESLANLVRNEKIIEQIVRSRTWSVMTEKCHISESWDDAMNRWRQSSNSEK
jgi:Caffeine-induced death protein 2